jgi:CheY-like chemotaxis protein
MTSILGFADILIDEERVENAPPHRIEALETIKRNGEFLLTLINDILDLSKIEAGKLQAEMVDCNPIGVIDEAVSLMRVRAEAKGISLDVQYGGVMPGTIKCDPLRLRQILVNLLSNAIKFTDTGGVRIISRLVLGVNGPSALQFDVIDTGIGISPENAQNLFTPFSQADSSVAKNYGGTGLGLVISRRLAEMLGGDVTFSSRPGKGSTFTLTVETGLLVGVTMLSNPAGEEPAEQTDGEETNAVRPENLSQDSHLANVKSADSAQRTAADTPSQKCEITLKGRVLLAEDGPDNRRLIEFFLKQAGAHVTTVENGLAACEEMQAALDQGDPFDVVLMDMQMPVKDGYDATRQSREAGYSAPIIALTAFAMEGDRQKCIDAGCDEYLAKPIKRDDLLSTVHRYSNAEQHAPQSATDN